MTLQQMYCTHNNNRIKTPLVHIASYYHLAWVDKSTLKTPFYVPPKKKKKKKKTPFYYKKKKKPVSTLTFLRLQRKMGISDLN